MMQLSFPYLFTNHQRNNKNKLATMNKYLYQINIARRITLIKVPFTSKLYRINLWTCVSHYKAVWVLQMKRIIYLQFKFVLDVVHKKSSSHSLFLLFSGNFILYATMVMEIMGGWKNSCLDNGSRCRNMFRSWEKTKKEIIIRLPMG